MAFAAIPSHAAPQNPSTRKGMMTKRTRRWWTVGLVALAAGSIFALGSVKCWAGINDEASQETQMKDDDSAKGESTATTGTTKEDAPTVGETDPSAEKDQ